MTIYESIFSVWRQPLLGVLFLILTGWMALMVAALRDGQSNRAKLALLTPFLLSMAILYLCMAFISWENNTHGGFGVLPGWLKAVGALPAWALALAEGLLAVPLVYAARETRRYRDSHLTPDSLKETMDLLPVGVAFAEADGTVVFRNLVMDQLSLSLTGALLTDLPRFRAAAGEEPLALNGRVWQLDFHDFKVKPLTQLTATDITEQAAILAGLEANNKKLKDIRLRLEIYNRQADRIIIAQELLTARMTVHDELGHILLESRHYLNDPAALDAALLLKSLKNTNTYLLREYEQDDTARDALADAVDMAGAIGVQVTIAGRAPTEEPGRGVLAAAILECAANAMKHAGASALTVRIGQSADGLRFTLENNGRAPAEPIRESGGLLSLRVLTESKGGSMKVESIPAFRLTILLPEWEARNI